MSISNRSFLAILTGFLSATSSLVAPRVHACRPVPCRPSVLHPAPGKVPADLFAVFFKPGINADPESSQAPGARLYRVSGWKREAIPLTLEPTYPDGFLVKPQQALPAGTVVAFEADSPTCGGGTKEITATYTLSEPRPIPASLGTLQVTVARATLVLPSNDGSCAAPLDVAHADLTLVPAPSAAALDGLLHYVLLVDGKPVDRTPDYRRDVTQSALSGSERVVGVCPQPGSPPPSQNTVRPWRGRFSFDDVALGAHRAKLVGTLPNGTVLETEEVAFDLQCE